MNAALLSGLSGTFLKFSLADEISFYISYGGVDHPESHYFRKKKLNIFKNRSLHLDFLKILTPSFIEI